MGGVPSILARRLQARYRWEPGPGLQRFEALELEEIYDPTQTGFADLAGATPVVKSKARLPRLAAFVDQRVLKPTLIMARLQVLSVVGCIQQTTRILEPCI